jgi:hypothetical protein
VHCASLLAQPCYPTDSIEWDEDYGWRPALAKSSRDPTDVLSCAPQLIPMLSPRSPELLASDFTQGSSLVHNLKFQPQRAPARRDNGILKRRKMCRPIHDGLGSQRLNRCLQPILKQGRKRQGTRGDPGLWERKILSCNGNSWGYLRVCNGSARAVPM